MSRQVGWLIVIIILCLFCGWVSLPETDGIHWDTDRDGTPDINFNIRQSLGLDLVGGLRVLLTAELPPGSFTVDDLRQAANNVARRVNALGVTEPTVQVQGSNRILVELPGISNREEAIDTIQQTAALEFVDFSGLGSQAQQLEGHKVLTTQQVLIEQQRQANAAAAENGQNSVESSLPETQEEAPVVNPLTGQPFETVLTGADLQAASRRPSGAVVHHSS